MSDGQTSEWTMGDRPKKSVPQTLRDMELSNGRLQSQIDQLNKDISENEKRLDKHRMYFQIIWVCAGVAGTLSGMILSWLLGKI